MKEPSHQEEPMVGVWTPYEDGGNDPDLFIPGETRGRFSLRTMLQTLFTRGVVKPSHE